MSRRVSFKVDFDLDFQFWHLVPSININLHSREIEFEWMGFLGLLHLEIVREPTGSPVSR